MKLEEKAKQFEHIIGVGDIHGEFPTLNHIIKTKQITDSVIVLCGDIGMGFNKPNYYTVEFTKLNKTAKLKNNLIVGVRGNHDNPEYFNGDFEFSNIKMMPDYSILETKNDKILFVGGGLSVDRLMRTTNISYWIDELPVFNKNKLDELDNPSIIASHSCATFAYPLSKGILLDFAKYDPQLLDDTKIERGVFDDVFNYYKNKNQLPRYWIYGHFHQSNIEEHCGVKFKLLDINEFYEIK